MNKKTGFIGVGNMGASVLCGAISGGACLEKDIYACSLKMSDRVKNLNINVTNLEDLVKNSDYIILSVKPDVFPSVLSDICKTEGYESKVYISIAAGITIDYIKKALGDVSVIRTMPNLPLSVGGGMTVICADSGVSEEDILFTERLFGSSGRTLRTSEDKINAYTALSGSGPAYAFMFIEALADAAVRAGIPRDNAYTVASQTLLGSAMMQLETGRHPAELKDMVCSPAGTTIDAVASLENDGFRKTVMNAVDACLKKADKMKK